MSSTPQQAELLSLEHARAQDAADPLRRFREQFEFPQDHAGNPLLYFAGNSLGLQPKTTRGLIEQELDDWARLAVEGHFDAVRPWYSYHELFRESGPRLVGANVGEVVMMNSLTVNLHLMMMSFYRPTDSRFKVLMEYPAFPSDLYAIQSHLHARGINPAEAIVTVRPAEDAHTIETAQIEEILQREGDSIALVLFGGVNYFTGQVLDMAAITELGHRNGCVVGFDLAHAAGNIPMELHDWNVDFAAWCTYKYLNSGPGAVAGCFVHEKHARNVELPRFAGWWGNDPDTRFRMQLEASFAAKADVDGWQISNPPILSLAPVKASLDLFDEATIPALRAKSVKLTGYMRELLEQWTDGTFTIITPNVERQCGCQLSLLVHEDAKQRLDALREAGIVCDFRQPNVIRIAPTPMYNSFEDVRQFVRSFTGRTD